MVTSDYTGPIRPARKLGNLLANNGDSSVALRQRHQVVDWSGPAGVDHHDYRSMTRRIDEEPAPETVRPTAVRQHPVSLISKRVPAEHLVGAAVNWASD